MPCGRMIRFYKIMQIFNSVSQIRTSYLIKFLACILLLLCSIEAANAQNPVAWSIRKSSSTAIQLGHKFTVQVNAQIADGWYLYSITQPKGGPIRTIISLPKTQSVRLAAAIKGPKPKIKFDENFDINVETYERTATFMLPLQMGTRGKAGRQKVLVDVRFQACNGEICLPPKTVRLEL